MGPPTVTVVGGGVAGLSAAAALAEAGCTVQVLERRSYLGGRASSFRHPGAGEVIDNCQHVLFGCCTNLIGFYERIGVAGQLYWTSEITLLEPDGRASVLGGSALPAPFHGLPRLWSAAALSGADKRALARAFAAMIRVKPDAPDTLDVWLRRHGQTTGAMENFWKLVIASALNSDLDRIGVGYAAKVIRELFLNSATAGRMGMSRVPLGDLYRGAVAHVEARGGRIQFNARVEALDFEGRPGEGPARARTQDGEIGSDYVILAVPFESAARLWPAVTPPAQGIDREPDRVPDYLRRLEHWPICSVHLWYDRTITDLDHAVLLGSDFHWMYNQSRLQPGREGAGSYLELVVSAARVQAGWSVERLVREGAATVSRYFPSARGIEPVKAAAIKEVHATFAVPPGIDDGRPGAVTAWPRLFLAGDWTRTGWPATMEGAARSGHLAAEAVLKAAGRPGAFLVPDLAPRGFMRLLA